VTERGREWVPRHSTRDLLAELARFNGREVERWIGAFLRYLRGSADQYALDDAKVILAGLRRKRLFELVQQTGEALIECGQDAPIVRRQLAQALIEQGRFTMAQQLLQRLVDDTRGDPAEHAEARGLLGRVFKQLYVRDPGEHASRRARYLEQAIEWYYGAYAGNPPANYWHGINVAACVMRGRRDGTPLADPPDARRIAQDVLQAIGPRSASLSAWQLATGMEACVALERADEALEWANDYVATKEADAFELGSTLRQLREVWELTPDREPGRSLLPLLEAYLLQSEGGGVNGSPAALQKMAAAIRSAELEVRLGRGTFLRVKWLEDGLARARAVASISDRFGDRMGTGFLIRGSEIHPSLMDQPLLLTNSHVLGGPPPPGKIAVPPREALVRFESIGPDGYRCHGQLLWTSPYNLYDASVIALARDPHLEVLLEYPAGITPFPWAPSLPPKDADRHVYVIGHPAGGDLSVSMQDNLLLDYDSRRVHYRAPTEEGSSGSPVFDDTWQLIALHHGGAREMPRLDGSGQRYEANEGIWIQAIRAGFAATSARA
jgi:tetratricopeptide (TPR) repeat protein